MSIYYLVASLSMLEFGSKPPLSSKEFLNECERLLPDGDYRKIARAMSDDDEERPGDGDTLLRWKRFSHNFRNELAWFRAVEANRDPSEYLRGERAGEPEVVDALAEAVKAVDPLIAEKILDQMLWRKIDELAVQHYFDVDFLITYALKLKILERYQAVDSPAGEKIFEKIKEGVLEL